MDRQPDELAWLRRRLGYRARSLSDAELRRVIDRLREVSRDRTPTSEHVSELIGDASGPAERLDATEDNSDLDSVLDDILDSLDGGGDGG